MLCVSRVGSGRVGEILAGVNKNTTHIPSASGAATYRIPDELTETVIGEVKNTQRLSYTAQLRDFAAYAEQENLVFNVYIRESTKPSGPLQAAHDAGVLNLKWILP
ncbi:putative toxin [Microbacterium sp. NPDC089189]|uniref:putative toxin n=1 Tax=Microbacterium sp. NPDC089189 TaxID=3154972 RepID=UPI00341FD819